MWKVYEEAFYDAIEDTEGAAKADVEGIHGERMDRYLAVFYDVADLRESIKIAAEDAVKRVAKEAAGE